MDTKYYIQDLSNGYEQWSCINFQIWPLIKNVVGLNSNLLLFHIGSSQSYNKQFSLAFTLVWFVNRKVAQVKNSITTDFWQSLIKRFNKQNNAKHPM